MSVLYLSYSGALDPLGRSQVLPYVVGLAGLGYRMRLVSFEKPASLQDTAKVRTLERELADRDVEWVPLRYHHRPALAATAYDVVRGIRVGRSLDGRRAIRLLHARSYVAGLMADRLARRTGIPWVFDMRGLWVEERVEAGIWAAGGPVARMARVAERRLLASSRAIVQLTDRGAELVKDLSPEVRPAEVSVIPTCVSMERFRPGDDPVRIRSELGIPTGPVMMYVGSLSTWYLPDLTLQVGGEFASRTGGSFVVLTREVEFAKVRASAMGVSPIVRSVEHDEVPIWMSAADVGLAFVRPGPAKRASAPTKVGEYLASGLAVVATSGVGDLDDHFVDSRVATTISAGEAPAVIVDRALEMLQVPGRAREARALAARYYDLKRGIEAYAALYRSLGVEPCV